MITVIFAMMVLMSYNTSIVFEDAFEEAFIGDYAVQKGDVIRERTSGSETKIFATTTTGEHIYVIYNMDTGLVKAKVWGDSGVIRIIEYGDVLPLF